ncbi:hypothetical protein HV824_12040 [Myxococcus sp. AM009]|uniref:hypothetical protein n=1 Tax=Myxococcus sp. AM009 TaxID=2745137 RepID=UPI001595E9BF|nr:hypothetical protein [Myxococcus sp. AM009]NVI98846.1 hypothetical protein [Myxococcus sp. AM009]
MPASPCPTPSSMLSKPAPADILTHVSKDSAKATAFLIRAFCAPTQDAEATRFVRAFGQARYLTRLETDPSVDAAYGSTASRFRSRWRTRVRRDARFIAALGNAPMPDVTREDSKRVATVVNVLRSLESPASRAQLRDHLRGKRPCATAGFGVLSDWSGPRVEYALDVLWQAAITTAPRRPGLNIDDLPANEKQVLDDASAAWLRAGSKASAAPAGARPKPRAQPPEFSIPRWKENIRSIDNRAFAEAWLDAARHNRSASTPMGIAHALSAVAPHAVPPVALLKRRGKLVEPHGILRHVVLHPDSRCRRIVFAALGSFKNTPFFPHFKRVLEDGTGEDRVVALAGALLVRPADKRGEKSLSTWLKDADPALLAKAHAFLRRHHLA